MLDRFPRADRYGVLHEVAREAGAVAVHASTAVGVPGVAARFILRRIDSPQSGRALAGAPHDRAAIVKRLLQRKAVFKRERADGALRAQSEHLFAHVA